ncbi:hypothetical protein Rhopal_003132-T1 [Rhodotorula paludigena]|uniref:ZZ-type domain-containing protein n=1 Tax=Rhodotorula paludigena TaxID=86838 RepID=A0AAV5GIW6_9BASI|nr:hypothetical protein Rhopal_003132-T1 [Rhodotorula paludigena]
MVRLTVKASLAGSGYPRRVTFPGEAFALARSFSLQPGSFRLAYLDDDNERIEVASTADLREALDYFSTDASSSASSSSGWFGKGHGASTEIASITLKLEILVEYDGPALSDTTSSVYSFGDGPPSRRGSSSAGSDVGAGWQRAAWPRPASRSRVAKSRARPASLSGSSDGGSDGWLREQAYSRSRGQQDAAAARDDREDDDWERRTVSSVSQPFDTSRPSFDEAPSRNAYDHYASHDTSRIPPPHENGSHDALFPNFARGRFSHHPHPYPPAPLEPLIPSRASPYQYLPPHGSPHGFGWSHFPPPPLPPPPQHGFAGLFPPHPGFYPPPPLHRPGSSLPSLSNGSGPSLQSDFGPSPTPSQRERARDLFASSSEEGSIDGGSESGQGEDARTSYTVTTSSEDAGEEAEGGGEARDEKCVRCDKALVGARFVCAVCEAYLLCQECEGLPPLLPSSTSSETHDDSHILLKVPASVASSIDPRAIDLARARASSLASASGSSGSAGTAAPEPTEGVADYWNWWASWYSTLPPVPPHPSHPPPPPPSSWYPPSALSVPPPPPAPTRAPSAPPATLAHLASLTPSSAASSAVSYTRPSRPPLRFPYPSHGVSCSSCSRTIPGPDSSFGEPLPPGSVEQGVRWLCANCPTMPSVDFTHHDSSHAFLRITHPIRRPLPSVKALLPLLYLPSPTTSGADGASDLVDLRSEAGRTSIDDGVAETGRADEEIVHDRVVCDACDRYIRGPWLRCCHCPQSFDLCEPCLLSGASLHAGHNPSHVFVKLRRKVDLPQLSRLTRLETRRPRGLLEVDLYA